MPLIVTAPTALLPACSVLALLPFTRIGDMHMPVLLLFGAVAVCCDIVAVLQTSRVVVLTELLGNLVLLGLAIRLGRIGLFRQDQLHRSGFFPIERAEGSDAWRGR